MTRDRGAALTSTVFLAAAGITYLFGIGLGFGRDPVISWQHYLLLRLVCCGVAAIGCLVGLVLNRPASRGPWIALIVLILSWALRPIRELYIPGAPPWGGYYFLTTVAVQAAAMVTAMIWISRLRRTTSDRASRLDIGILLAGFLAFELHAGVIPGLGLSDSLPYQLGFGFVAPLGFAVTIAYLARLIFIETVPGPAFVMFAVSFGGILLPQVYTVFLTISDNVPISIAVDTAPLVTSLLAAAALHPSMRQITQRSTMARPDWSMTRCVVLVGAAVLPVAALLTGARPGTAEAIVLFALSVVLMTLVIWRARSAVTALDRAERSSRQQSLTDSLTGLLNRRGALQMADNLTGRPYGVAFADIDGFKRLNDVHGYLTGDEVLVEVGRRLNESAVGQGSAVRLGGDEFAVFFTGPDLVAAGDEAVDAVRLALATPVTVGRHTLQIRASVGLADTDSLSGPGSGPAEASFLRLLRRADTAMHVAKSGGGSRTLRFSPEMEERTHRAARVTEALSSASARGWVSVDYQAVVGIDDPDHAVITGAEALMRLRLPDLGPVSPVEFIPLAERTGQILELGGWIFTAALGELSDVRHQLPEEFRLSINVSTVQLGSDHFVRKLERFATENTILVPYTRVEITESAVADRRAREALDRIAASGLQLALDDFGADYASLQYLTSLPVQVLKLDRSFVGRMEHQPADRAIVRHVLALARDLRITVIAEGVETAAQARLLRDDGCRYAQGFLWDRPAPLLSRLVGDERPWLPVQSGRGSSFRAETGIPRTPLVP